MVHSIFGDFLLSLGLLDHRDLGKSGIDLECRRHAEVWGHFLSQPPPPFNGNVVGFGFVAPDDDDGDDSVVDRTDDCLPSSEIDRTILTSFSDNEA